MPQRKTQRREYWVENFKIEQSDLDHIYSILLEQELPLSVDEMALIVVRHHVQNDQQVSTPAQQAPRNQYHPTQIYSIGDQVAFPSYNNALGTVTATRSGENAAYGTYTVLEVQLEDGRRLEFSSGVSPEHLNAPQQVEEEVIEEGPERTPEEIFIEWGGAVIAALEDRMQENEDLVRLAGRWFPKSLLANVNSGHLNLAEAVLDMNEGGPMATLEIIDQAGMMQNVSSRLAEFSLNYGLQKDPRFDEVGPSGQVLWYLSRLEPDGVQSPPPRLEYTEISSDDSLLTQELRDLERQIGDEHSNIPSPRSIHPPESVTVTLIYPHRRAGTLPLSPQLRQMFPTAYSSPRIRFTLIDAESKAEYPAWVVRNGGYVYGLDKYFEEHDVLIGSSITIQRTKDPSRVRITAGQRKARKEWVRTAVVQNNRLTFQSIQRPVATDYDDLLIFDVADPAAVDTLWQRVKDRKTPLEDVMGDLLRELAALNPQGTVHAKTLYSAVNLIKRTPPGPLFARLVALPEFQNAGGPYWRLGDAG